jgi:zinc transporter 9
VLVLGRRIPEEVRDNAVGYLLSQPSVQQVSAVQSRVIGSGDFKLKAEVDFNGEHLAQSLSPWVFERVPSLTDQEACNAFTAEFGERLMELLAREVDRLEGELRSRHPELKHLDLEAD